MTMRFEMTGHRGAVNFVAAYAPTEVAGDDIKPEFWGKLGSLVRRISSKECMYILMDANARMRERMEKEDDGVMRMHGCDELNENGRLLLTFAAENNLALANTFFETRKGGIWHTYNGASGTDRWRPDFILTRQAHRGRVSSMVVIPQPVSPVKADPDHNMVLATVKTVKADPHHNMVITTVNLGGRLAHSRAVRTKPKQRQFDRRVLQVEATRWAVTTRFLLNLGQRQDERATTTPEKATEFTNARLEVARAILPEEPRRRRSRERCETPETRAALEEALTKRREARQSMKDKLNTTSWRALTAACEGVAAAVQTGKYAHLDRYVTDLEAIYKDHDMKGLYQRLKRSVGLSGRQAGGQQSVVDENGVLLRRKNDILKRWARFFGTLLNTKSPTLNPDVIEQVTHRPATRATRRLGEVPDLEEVERATKGLQNWKAPGNDSLPAELLKIDDHDEEPIVLKHLHAPSSLRGISLLSHVGKVPVKIITNSQSAFYGTNNILPEEQCGFRPGRSTIDILLVVRRLQELGRRRKIPLYMCFVDLKKEYDSADRELLWKVLARAGIPEEMIAVIRQFHDGMTGENDDRHRGGVREEVFGELGLTVSEKKTETLLMRAKEKQTTTTTPPPPPPPLIVEAAGQRYAHTTELRYLGGLVNEHGDLTREINYRNKAAWACVRRYGQELFDRPRAPFRLKTRLLQAEAMEALLYGCMTWAPRQDQYRTLRTIHHRLLLRVVGYQRMKCTYRQLSYAQTLKRVGCQSVESTIRQRRLLFAGALARQPDGRLPKRLMLGELVGGEGSGRGKPEQNWQMCLKDDLKMFEAEHGSTDAEPCFFGVLETTWVEKAKVDRGVSWHTGVLQGAQRCLASWHKKEQEASRQRELKRNKKPGNNTDAASTTRAGGVQKADETARKARKREEADRMARSTVPN
ncbi:unnamed protein product [Ectocarpus sp. CCAP 1310/34]|nr:unnamed protein product [Ectocarpus sp. CCAP 1310/34]